MDKYGIINRLEELKEEVSKDMPESHSSLIRKGIELAIKEVELISQVKLPKKTAREFSDEMRKEKILESYEKVKDKNGEALRKLDN